MLAKQKRAAYLVATSIPIIALFAHSVSAESGYKETNKSAYSEEFWLWFDRYADDEGNLLDPLELNDVAQLDNSTNEKTDKLEETHTEKNTTANMTPANNTISTSVTHPSHTDQEDTNP